MEPDVIRNRTLQIFWFAKCSHPLGKDVEHRGVINTQNKRRLDLAMKHVEGSCTVERKAFSNIILVLEEAFLAPAGEARAAFYLHLGCCVT